MWVICVACCGCPAEPSGTSDPGAETPGGQTFHWRSQFQTALRRVAHVVQTGEWNELTATTQRVPEAVDDLWSILQNTYIDFAEAKKDEEWDDHNRWEDP